MKTLRQTLERNLYAIAAAAFLVAATAPNLLAAQVYADQVTDRYVKMGNSAVGTDTLGQGVTYEIGFSTVDTAEVNGIVVDFCEESPLASDECTKPTGMTLGTTLDSVEVNESADATWTSAAVVDTSAVSITSTGSGDVVGGGDDVVITLSGFTNPEDVGTFYARILTFASAATAGNYESETTGTYLDYGGVALSTTENIEITARVFETLTFCVSGQAPEDNCGNTSTPSIELGEDFGDIKALTTDNVSTANVYFQLNTNTLNGAIVNMAGDTLSNGSHDINPVGDGESATPISIGSGVEAFGFHVSNGVESTLDEGIGTVTADAAYATGSDVFNFIIGAGGINSVYGDTIASASTGDVVANMNSTITFGAQIAPATPAGIYTATLSLIASSTY